MAESIETRLSRRFRRFLNGSKGMSGRQAEPIRKNALEVLRRATSRHWRTYIVGGAIRDLLLGPPRSWPRDVDVIVDGCSADDLEDAFRDIAIRRTSFGGLHLRKTVEIEGLTTAKYDLLFDVWRLEDTWAIKTGELAPTISKFLDTPFLNIDSIAVALPKDRSRLMVYERGFFEAVVTRTLEINSEPNPFPFVCAIRSLILAAKLDFWIGPRLAHFIQVLMSSAPISELLKAQVSHYGRIRCDENEIKEWLGNLRSQLDTGLGKVRLMKSQEQQLHLWQDWPPHSLLYAAHSDVPRESRVSRAK
jgi:poly(A) polymerase-like protein